MRKTLTLGPLALALLAPALAAAHPQHAGATLMSGFVHPFLGLDHVLAMIAVGVWAAQMGARAVWAVPTSFVTAMLAGGVLGLIGVEVTAVEPLVAATVLILGMLIMRGVHASVMYGASLAAVFAIFHGAAHLAEAPANENLIAYATGLVVATVLLNLFGICAAFLARGRATVWRLAAAPVALAGALMLVSRIG